MLTFNELRRVASAKGYRITKFDRGQNHKILHDRYEIWLEGNCLGPITGVNHDFNYKLSIGSTLGEAITQAEGKLKELESHNN